MTGNLIVAGGDGGVVTIFTNWPDTKDALTHAMAKWRA